MNIFYVRSKMNEEDFKEFLLYNQYYSERYYLALRVTISVVIGLLAAYFSSEKLLTFIILVLVCLAVFIAFPWAKIKFRYKKIYKKNKKTTFSNAQLFKFSEDRLGFKNESEKDYYYVNYHDLYKVVETNSMFIIFYSKKQIAVVNKHMAGTENTEKIRNIFIRNIRKRYSKIMGLAFMK